MSQSIEVLKINIGELPKKTRDDFYFTFFEDDALDHCTQIKLFLDVDDEDETRLRMAHPMSNDDEGEIALGLDQYNFSMLKGLLDFISSDENKKFVTYGDGFKEEDIIKIFYLDMRYYSRAYDRDACRYIVDLIVNQYNRLEKMNFSNRTVKIPEDYFSKNKIQSIFVRQDEFNLLLDEGMLEFGKYADAEECSDLDGDEIEYLQWMCGNIKNKPVFEIGAIEKNINVFKKIFDKSKENDLELEF